MQSKAKTPDEYILELPEDRKIAITKLREVISTNLPSGFKEEMSYGMIGYVVPHEIYPSGYHCTPKLPLPFINIASQKNYISVYHMGLFEGTLLDWFKEEWAKQSDLKLDIGKCCIRMKKIDKIPYMLFGTLSRKLSVQEWIQIYEEKIKR